MRFPLRSDLSQCTSVVGADLSYRAYLPLYREGVAGLVRHDCTTRYAMMS
jgi:hypothetical protein